MDGLSFFAMECNDCGWDWIGMFAVCSHCGSSNVELVEEDTDEKMFNRLYWISLKNINGFYDPFRAINTINRNFGIG